MDTPPNVSPLRARIARGGWRAASRWLALELSTTGRDDASASPVRRLALRRGGVNRLFAFQRGATVASRSQLGLPA
jgi:hypothetical protein